MVQVYYPWLRVFGSLKYCREVPADTLLDFREGYLPSEFPCKARHAEVRDPPIVLVHDFEARLVDARGADFGQDAQAGEDVGRPEFEVDLLAGCAEGGGALDEVDFVGWVGPLQEGGEGGAADAGADYEDVEGGHFVF